MFDENYKGVLTNITRSIVGKLKTRTVVGTLVLPQKAAGNIPDVYDGDYEVTPKITEQTLPTERKLMTDDVKILSIPFYRVDNEFKGQTIIIGG